MNFKQTALILAIIHNTVLFSNGQANQQVKIQVLYKDSLVTIKTTEILIYELSIPKLKDYNFPETTVNIKLKNSQPTFIQFHSGGTETDILMIDSVRASNYNNIWDSRPLKKLQFGDDESGLIDISDLSSGVYFIRYSSCNFGGIYKLVLTE